MFCIQNSFFLFCINAVKKAWKLDSESSPLIKEIQAWFNSGISLIHLSLFSPLNRVSNSCLFTPFPSSELSALSLLKGQFFESFICCLIFFSLIIPLIRKNFAFPKRLYLFSLLYFSLISSSALYLAFSRWIFFTLDKLASRS